MERASSLVYRAACPADLEQLKALRVASYSEFLPALTPVNQERLHHALHHAPTLPLLLQQAAGFVCVQDDLLAGMAFLMPSGHPTDIYPADWCYIRLVGVHPDFRGRGIARQLTLQCLEQARQAGEHTIALHTSEKMDAARHIYESLGFKQVREIDPIFGMRYWLYAQQLAS